jgi:hypothetical protein
MQKLFVTLAALGVIAAPALAQDVQSPQNTDNQAKAAPAEKPKTVKKVVCKRIEEERSIGSRLSSTTKVCRTVEVPATEADAKNPQGDKSAR